MGSSPYGMSRGGRLALTAGSAVTLAGGAILAYQLYFASPDQEATTADCQEIFGNGLDVEAGAGARFTGRDQYIIAGGTYNPANESTIVEVEVSPGNPLELEARLFYTDRTKPEELTWRTRDGEAACEVLTFAGHKVATDLSHVRSITVDAFDNGTKVGGVTLTPGKLNEGTVKELSGITFK